ncbi:linear amide C-N hydrolase [Anabaena azotica]|uniref:Linear amide C-N hydrolase n=1 Tax=Anabaena azotica FACHB-119 TaxID=947527 RepID=A0ABR8D120_9NOST|nr:linear amide C-N hydrolase [Anabaena azotica]MBD2499463.1 linear amide C-N hydrolase [Anabaena azotica FACHB-119]
MKFGLRTVAFAIPSLLVSIAALLACGFIQAPFNIHQPLSNLMNDFQLGLIPLLLLGCTRAIYAFEENSYITVRSMDWSDPNMSLSLWASPSGKSRVGANNNSHDNPLKWESKYASLVVCNYGKGTTDGMNEKGLVINLHFLPDADYGEPNKDPQGKPNLAVSGWGQYVLDKFATVAEAVEDLKKQTFTIVTDHIPFLVKDKNGGYQNEPKKIVVHLGISDASGDSAILQYVKVDEKSQLNIYHHRNYKVMTNSPYNRQLEILEKLTDQSQDEERKWNKDKIENFDWDALTRKDLNGDIVKEMTPPMNGADIRYIRASFFSDNIEKITEPRIFLEEETQEFFKGEWSYEEAIARAFSLIRNMSTPLNVKSLDNPFLSSTIWRTVADQKNKRYFLETARTLYPIYVDLPELFKSIRDKTHKLVVFEPPKVKGGESTDLQQEQKDNKKIGKVNEYFQPTEEDWFDFDPL